MNCVIDIGNSRVKTGLFEGGKLISQQTFTAEAEAINSLKGRVIDNLLVSAGKDANPALWTHAAGGRCLILNHELPLPVRLHYETPNTLGSDRMAAVCGAHSRFPNRDVMVIDMGTCITYDIKDTSGTYLGGAISPGTHMRLNSMHTFTGKLPKVDPDFETTPEYIGKSTRAGLLTGVYHGIKMEIDGFIDLYRGIYPDLVVLVCGGDHPLFSKKIENPCTACPFLVLEGLNAILNHNVATN